MNIRRYLPGLLLGLVVLLIAGGLLYGRGYRLMQHISAPGPPTSAPEAKEGRKIKHWMSSMDPKYVSDKPGKDPMGMDLVPVYEDAPGMGPRTIAVDPQTLQSMGVRTAKAEIRPLSRVIRAVGKVAYDERRLALVNTKMDGWVDRLFIKTTGELVKKGQPLLSLYSRELVPAQQEYLLALKYQQSLAKSTFPEIAEGGNRLAEASRRRLEYFDISPSQIEALKKTGKVKKDLLLTSPVHGIVVKRMVTQGQFVMSGMTLLEVADLSTVWVEADIYEYELPWVAVGQRAEMTLSYLPGETFTGHIEYLYPYLKDMTRTAKVRLKFANPGLKLKPDMFAQVEIKSPLKHATVVVPREAVLNTGEKQHVFLALGQGRFDPREVKLGAQGGEGLVQILAGLQGGEDVVTSAVFLLDSESRFREGATKMLQPPKMEGAPAGAPPPGAPPPGAKPPVHRH